MTGAAADRAEAGRGGAGPSRIVVSGPAPIGDFLHGLPAVHALRDRFTRDRSPSANVDGASGKDPVARGARC